MPLEVDIHDDDLEEVRERQSSGQAYYGCLNDPGTSLQPPLPKRFMADCDAREGVQRSFGSVVSHLREQFPAPHTKSQAEEANLPESMHSGKKARMHLAGLRANAPEQQVASMPFTPAEDRVIVEMRKAGCSWPEIASRFNRSVGALKKRYYDSLKVYVEGNASAHSNRAGTMQMQQHHHAST